MGIAAVYGPLRGWSLKGRGAFTVTLGWRFAAVKRTNANEWGRWKQRHEATNNSQPSPPPPPVRHLLGARCGYCRDATNPSTCIDDVVKAASQWVHSQAAGWVLPGGAALSMGVPEADGAVCGTVHSTLRRWGAAGGEQALHDQVMPGPVLVCHPVQCGDDCQGHARINIYSLWGSSLFTGEFTI